jgi:hypothetical protein
MAQFALADYTDCAVTLHIDLSGLFETGQVCLLPIL